MITQDELADLQQIVGPRWVSTDPCMMDTYSFYMNPETLVKDGGRWTPRPVAVVLPEGTRKAFKTPAGNYVVVCPNALNPKATCQNCRLCQKADRKPIIGFPVHGSGKKHFDC